MQECPERCSLAEILFREESICDDNLLFRYQNLIDSARCQCCGIISPEELSRLHNDKGQALYRRVDFDEAVKEYTKAIQIDPSFSVAYYNRGQIHYRLGRFMAALDDFKQALRHNPEFADAKYGQNATLLELNSTQR